jgi:hypothetical protein
MKKKTKTPKEQDPTGCFEVIAASTKAVELLCALMASLNKTEFWTPAMHAAYRDAEKFLREVGR